MIRATGVVHHYGVRPVLKNINLHVEAGELLALMGPNGMGKSTLLAVLAGVLSPLRGTVEIAGRLRRGSVADEAALRKQVVYLPDQPWLPGLRTGREFLLAVGRLYEIDSDRLMDHAEQLLALFQLTRQADAPIRTYSTGQQKKVAICSALVSEAPVLLIDEPFSGGLDPSAILALKQVLKRLAERKDVTVVMATPVPELVEELAQRVAVLREGEIVACETVAGLRRLSGCDGSLDEVYERLANPDILDHIERYLRRPSS